jgi:hypothetical protein
LNQLTASALLAMDHMLTAKHGNWLVAAAQKIFEYLTSHVPESYCDNCLDEEIGLGIPPAVVVIPLMTTGLFTRELGKCAKCRETKTVTHANRT